MIFKQKIRYNHHGDYNEKNHVEFKKINPFDMDITYIEPDSVSPLNVYNPHIHEECEIYINISGNVSFEVENRLYPLTPESVIITRPYEYHHCIYHNNDLHKHFWILFSARGNEELFKLFWTDAVSVYKKEASYKCRKTAEPRIQRNGGGRGKWIWRLLQFYFRIQEILSHDAP